MLVLLLLMAPGAFAQGTLSVSSTNDGAGQFGWTISSGISLNLDHFQMKLYGVQAAFGPQGWSASIDPNEVVTWSYLGGGAPFTGSSMALSIRSTSTQSVPYGGIGNTTYPDGLSWGPVGFVRFAYDGPVQVPEPRAVFLSFLAAVIIGIKKRITNRPAASWL